MADLGSFIIASNGKYTSVETATGLTFTSGTTYTMQLIKPATMCESATAPTSGGTLVDTSEPFQYKAGSDTLYIKTEGTDTVLNIAE